MVLGNPHFPWHGSQRFYQSHLTIPGKADVAGASLFGVPIVLIGHTKNFAWSHTVSTARRFTPFELKLVPGSPTSYLYDGQVRQMKADRVTVSVPGGTRTRTLYSTVHGPVVTSIVGLPLFPWTPSQAHALGDVNAANFRYLNHFLETNMTQSVRAVRPRAAAQPGHPVGQQHRRRLPRRGLLRRHRGDPQRPQREGAPVQHRAGVSDHQPAWAADPRRLAHGVPVERGRGRHPVRGSSAPATCRASSAATT